MCRLCRLRFHADQPSCPRCKNADPGQPLPGYEFAGFWHRRTRARSSTRRSDIAERNLCEPIRSGTEALPLALASAELVVAPEPQARRFGGSTKGVRLPQRELDEGVLMLHGEGKGYLLCSTCGHMLTVPPPVAPNQNRGRQRPRGNANQAGR